MNKERFTTFVDAVLAIIMTILVLELQKPDPVTLQGFWALKENFFAYALSFFWLGTMWVNLHNGWYKVKRIDGYTIWTTLVMLFFSTLYPYATSIASQNFNNTAAQVFYGLIVMFITLFNYFSYYAIAKANDDSGEVALQVKSRNRWLRRDMGIKITGFIIAATVYPPAMMYSVLVTLVFLVIPNQVKYFKNQKVNKTKKN